MSDAAGNSAKHAAAHQTAHKGKGAERSPSKTLYLGVLKYGSQIRLRELVKQFATHASDLQKVIQLSL